MFPSICLAKQCFSTAHSISKPTQDPTLRSLAPPGLSALFSQIQNLLLLKLAKICSSVSFLLHQTFVDPNAGTLSSPRGLSLQPGMCIHVPTGSSFPIPPSSSSPAPSAPRRRREGFPTNFRPRPSHLLVRRARPPQPGVSSKRRFRANAGSGASVGFSSNAGSPVLPASHPLSS